MAQVYFKLCSFCKLCFNCPNGINTLIFSENHDICKNHFPEQLFLLRGFQLIEDSQKLTWMAASDKVNLSSNKINVLWNLSWKWL